MSTVLLVWRVIDGDSPARILIAVGLVVMWVCLLTANRTARRTRAGTS
ncbi:hypothetical protein ACFWBB_01825 [Streptomyces sp. NPDC060000]